MGSVFLRIVNLSIKAGWLILAVVIARFLLKKAPKWISCVLWALVAVRLICPFSLESALSLIPSSETIPYNIEMMQKPAIDSGITAINEAVNPAITHSFAPDPVTSANPLQIIMPVLSIVWIIGMSAMLLYALFSYIRLKRSIGVSIPVKDNILACDEVKSPFILGIIKPLICIPSSMEGEALDYVITHESAHIKRRDHWWKPLGFLLLAVYWFHPLCWLSYVLLCRDIEMACDEKVIRDMDKGGIAAYSQALLDCSFPRRGIAACPLAFGEVGVKERVRSVLNYKKPAFWIIAVAAAACIVVIVCFMTDPKENEPDLSFLNYENACALVSDVTDVDTVYYPPMKKNEDGQISIGYANGNDLAKYLDSVSWQKCKAPQGRLPSPGSIVFYIGDGYRITVYKKPRRAAVTYGDEIRYYKTHGGDYADAARLFEKWSMNSKAMKWFDALNGDEMMWDGIRELELDEYPGVTFRCSAEKLEAVTDRETIMLYMGMPIWSVYFCDLNGDGKSEICSSVSLGSGIIDQHIEVSDYANGAVHALVDRGKYDYVLTFREGRLWAEKRAYMQDEVLEAGPLVLRNVTGTDGTAISMLMIEQYDSENIDSVSGIGGVDGPKAVDMAVDYKAKGTCYSLSDQGKLNVSGSIDSDHSYVQSQKFWTNSTEISVKNYSGTDVTAYLFSTENENTPILELKLSNKEKMTFSNLSSRFVYYVRISTDSSANVNVDISD